MTITRQAVVVGVDDLKIYELTADTTISLTYNTAIDVPGIQKIELAPSVTEKSLKEDEKVLDYYVKTDFIAWSFNSAKISLDVLAILEGGSVATTGTAPNQVNTYSITQASEPKYFKLEAKANYTAGENGDFHLKLYKCKANNIDILYLANDYAVVSATGVAIATTNNGKLRDYVINETPVAIS